MHERSAPGRLRGAEEEDEETATASVDVMDEDDNEGVELDDDAGGRLERDLEPVECGMEAPEVRDELDVVVVLFNTGNGFKFNSGKKEFGKILGRPLAAVEPLWLDAWCEW